MDKCLCQFLFGEDPAIGESEVCAVMELSIRASVVGVRDFSPFMV